jgi:RND family efflux transporter MFP subunit
MNRACLRLLLVLLPLLGALAGCVRGAASTPAPAASRYAAMARGVVDVEGGVIAVGAPRDGRIVALPAAEGDSVRAGDVLAQLDSSAAELALATAQAELAQAQAQLAAQLARLPPAQRRAARLDAARREGLATDQSADDAAAQWLGHNADLGVSRAAVALAQRRLETAQWELAQRRVLAPVDAYVARRQVAVGSSVAAQPPTELFVLVPRQPLVVRADIEQDFVERVHPGMSAEVVDEVAPDKVYTAKVERLGDMFGHRSSGGDAANERQDVRVLDCTLVLKDGALRVGQRVLVRFVAGT